MGNRMLFIELSVSVNDRHNLDHFTYSVNGYEVCLYQVAGRHPDSRYDRLLRDEIIELTWPWPYRETRKMNGLHISYTEGATNPQNPDNPS